MRLLLIFITFIMATANCFAQSYEELIEKSYDFLDKKDLVSAEESLRAAMRLEPGNPMNYALLTNLGSIQRRASSKMRCFPIRPHSADVPTIRLSWRTAPLSTPSWEKRRKR